MNSKVSYHNATTNISYEILTCNLGCLWTSFLEKLIINIYVRTVVIENLNKWFETAKYV